MTAPMELLDDDSLARSLDQLREVMEAAPAAAEQVGRDAAIDALDQRWRKLFAKTILGVGAVFVLFSLGLLLLFSQLGVIGDKVTNQDAALQRSVVSIQTLQDQLDASNVRLRALGLPTVTAPTNVQPGTPQQAQLTVAAATASTLASLPQSKLAVLKPADIAAAVASYMQTNPPTISADQIIAGVSSYMTAHPDQFRGPPGTDGVPGRPPTEEEIQQAFRREVTTNPQILCPVGGTYGNRTVQLAGGATVVQYGCFGTETGPPAAGGGDTGPTAAPEPGNPGGGGAATPPPTTSQAAPSAPATTSAAPTTDSTSTPPPPPDDGGSVLPPLLSVLG